MEGLEYIDDKRLEASILRARMRQESLDAYTTPSLLANPVYLLSLNRDLMVMSSPLLS